MKPMTMAIAVRRYTQNGQLSPAVTESCCRMMRRENYFRQTLIQQP
jgi:hypothetical protein